MREFGWENKLDRGALVQPYEDYKDRASKQVEDLIIFTPPKKTQHRSANTRYISQMPWQFFWSARSRAATHRWNPRKCLELPLANGAYCHSLIQGLIFLLVSLYPVSAVTRSEHDVENVTDVGISIFTSVN